MLVRALAVLGILLASSIPAFAHDWYVGKNDPVTGGSCCTTAANSQYGDCAVLQIVPGVITGEVNGYRIVLTEEQARKINPLREGAVNILVPWNRVQPSLDGNFHLCIPASAPKPSEHSGPRGDFYCFWAPPSS